MPQVNAKQIVLMILAMLSFTATGISAMEAVIGVTAVKAVAAIATFVGGLMAAAMTPFLSNTSVATDAAALPGVNLQVNRQASPQIAALAVDDKQNSIAPAPGEERAVVAKAETINVGGNVA